MEFIKIGTSFVRLECITSVDIVACGKTVYSDGAVSDSWRVIYKGLKGKVTGMSMGVFVTTSEIDGSESASYRAYAGEAENILGVLGLNVKAAEKIYNEIVASLGQDLIV